MVLARALLMLAVLTSCGPDEPVVRQAHRRGGTTRVPRSAPEQPPLAPPPEGATTTRDAHLCAQAACAIGRAPADLDLGLREVRRVGRWVELEGGLWYFVGDDGLITRLRLRPCPPLRGDFASLTRHGFTLTSPALAPLYDASGIRGIDGHWLEGRPSSCIISRSR